MNSFFFLFSPISPPPSAIPPGSDQGGGGGKGADSLLLLCRRIFLFLLVRKKREKEISCGMTAQVFPFSLFFLSRSCPQAEVSRAKKIRLFLSLGEKPMGRNDPGTWTSLTATVSLLSSFFFFSASSHHGEQATRLLSFLFGEEEAASCSFRDSPFFFFFFSLKGEKRGETARRTGTARIEIVLFFEREGKGDDGPPSEISFSLIEVKLRSIKKHFLCSSSLLPRWRGNVEDFLSGKCVRSPLRLFFFFSFFAKQLASESQPSATTAVRVRRTWTLPFLLLSCCIRLFFFFFPLTSSGEKKCRSGIRQNSVTQYI